MHFQQSRIRPYERRLLLRPPVKIGAAPRRLWFIRPRTILIVACAAIVGWFVSDRLWIKGQGIVSGELTAVSPIVQARIQRLFVKCLDHVARGQPVAEFVNEPVVQTADQQIKQLELQLAQTRAEIDIADREAQTAQKLVDAQDALLQQQVAVLKSEDQLKEQKFVAELVWQQAKAAVDRADAEKRAAEFVYETKKADRKMAEVNVGILEKRIESYKNSPELTGHFFVNAPKDGVVTECTAREGEVIAARTPIFSIFNPNETYAVVFFSPSDVPRLAKGQTFNVNVGGVNTPIKGTVTDFYPELSALPGSLTRFFWQQEMWSQYTPVRIDFVDVSPEERSRLFAWAQVSVSHWDGWGISGAPAIAMNSWDWARRNVLSAWQFVMSTLQHG